MDITEFHFQLYKRCPQCTTASGVLTTNACPACQGSRVIVAEYPFLELVKGMQAVGAEAVKKALAEQASPPAGPTGVVDHEKGKPT